MKNVRWNLLLWKLILISITITEINFPQSSNSLVDVMVSFPETLYAFTDTFEIPMLTDNLSGLDVFSYQGTILFDTSKVRLLQVMKSGTMSSDYSVSSNLRNDTVLFAASGTSALTGSGTLLLFTFMKTVNELCGLESPLEFVHFQYNEGTPASVTSNGGVYLCSPPEVPTLVAPPDNVAYYSITPILQWADAARASSYHLQVSEYLEFAMLALDDSGIASTSLQADSLAYGTEYFWRVRSENVSGVSEWSEIRSLTTVQRITMMSEIRDGWNLLSLPLTVDNGRIAALFYSYQYGFIYTPAGYWQVDSVRNGEGFWMRFAADTGTTFMGITGLIREKDTAAVHGGWNLVGATSGLVPVSSIAQIPDSNIVSDFFEFDGAYQAGDTLVPMKGYWVKVKSDGMLILSGETAGQRIHELSPNHSVLRTKR
ncbi:MAG: hypothetical protein EPO24_14225 [Bacteroidetes bacterium]|nr:MAG: hypothetical protein EPO24_14225 [Bacteroidota bacterium]